MTSRTRVWVGWGALGVLLVGVLGWALWPSGTTTAAERAHNLDAELRCPDCESLSAADSQTDAARAIRSDVRRRVAEGESDGEIRRAYVDRYGDSILLKPSTDGLGLIVWGLPVVAVLAGAGALFFTFRRWRRAEPLRPSDADEALVRRARDSTP